MSKEDFKQELDEYGLSLNWFLDLRDAWNSLSCAERLDLLKEEAKNNEC